MKIQTNAGEVELTAEMVCKGMVFRHGVDDAFTLRQRLDRERWETKDFAIVRPLLAVGLLGCDPEHAARADCEVYGIAPGIDAGAHGFARLRGGGAVDLRRATPAGTVHEWDGKRRVRHARADGRIPRVYPLSKFDRFIGLDARHARPEDVRWLCCGAARPAHGSAWSDGSLAPWPHRCTLAIGDHDEHECLATGTRWPAKEGPAPGTDAFAEREMEALRRTRPTLAEAYEYAAKKRGIHVGGVKDHMLSEDAAERKAGADISGGGTKEMWTGGWPDVRSATGQTLDALAEMLGIERKPAAAARTAPKTCDSCGVGEGALHDPTCAHVKTWEAKHCGAHPARWQRLGGMGVGVQVATGRERCCLSKQHDGEHQDWNADVHWADDVQYVLCDRCGERVMPPEPGFATQVAAQEENGSWRKGTLCEACGKKGGDLVWRGGRLVAKAEGFSLTGIGEPSHLSPTAEAILRAPSPRCPDCGVEPQQRHAEGCAAAKRDEETLRRIREAPLIALVNAVPDGLDPAGWRAAVLAFAESSTPEGIARWGADGSALEWLAGAIRGEKPDRAVHDAYRRAITPHKPPERRLRVTRGPKIVVDDGRDE